MIGIYIIKNKINGKIYVGQTTNFKKRKTQHLNRYKRKDYKEHSRLYKAMHKHGVENFDFIFLEKCSKEKLNEREMALIEHFDSYKNGYNATKGGNNPVAYWEGKKRDEETNEKIAEKLRGKSWGSHSKEARQKISEGHKGNQNGNKKVLCVELGLVFESIKSAAKFINRDPSGITVVLKGRKKTCGGYHWKYFSSQETIPKGSTVGVELPLEVQEDLQIKFMI